MDITQLNENLGQTGLGNALEKYYDKPPREKQTVL